MNGNGMPVMGMRPQSMPIFSRIWKSSMPTTHNTIIIPRRSGEPFAIFTPAGEAADSKHLTLAYDSINYDPAQHVIYLPQSLTDGQVNIYSAEGELIKSIPISATYNVIPLNDAEFQQGAIYIVKYLPNGTMGRKTPWIKILFH